LRSPPACRGGVPGVVPPPVQAEKAHTLRRTLSDMNPVESVELLRKRLQKVESNRLFLMTMNLA